MLFYYETVFMLAPLLSLLSSAITAAATGVPGPIDSAMRSTPLGPRSPEHLSQRQDRGLSLETFAAVDSGVARRAPYHQHTKRGNIPSVRGEAQTKRKALKRSEALYKRATDDPFCHYEYGTPDPDDCERAWHQIPNSYEKRWFYNGNYDHLPRDQTSKPLDVLPQSWQSGNCRIETKFALDEELNSDYGRGDPNDMLLHGSHRSPFAYRPFDETSWDTIDDTALDIVTHCVSTGHGNGGTNIVASDFRKIEINVYSLDSTYKTDSEAATAAAAAAAANNHNNQAPASETDDGPSTPRNPQRPLTRYESPQNSPYWFMLNCPAGNAIYCTKDTDCGAACGPGRSCKIRKLIDSLVTTGIQMIGPVGSCGSA
ncbi:MAG: hypothetical protein M1836_001186 [Candelina mexicana]|nr:MAG: hypothetical protein M1836_001186 [Candelina mexicana]